MPKTFEELMQAARELQTSSNPTAPQITKGSNSPGWRKLDEPPGTRQYLNFIAASPLEDDEDFFHLFRPGQHKEEILEVERPYFRHLDSHVRIVIHGHSAKVPCSTPDGCFEVKE